MRIKTRDVTSYDVRGGDGGVSPPPRDHTRDTSTLYLIDGADSLPSECYDQLKIKLQTGKCFDGLVVQDVAWPRRLRFDSWSGQKMIFSFFHFFQMTLFGINKISLVNPFH